MSSQAFQACKWANKLLAFQRCHGHFSCPSYLKKIGRGTRIFSQHNFGANCCIFHEDGVGFRFLDFGIWNLDLDQFACAAEQSSSRIGIKPSLCQDDWQGDSVLLQTWRQKFLTKLASCQTVSGHHTQTHTHTHTHSHKGGIGIG